MPNLLLELFSEEIPARMQAQAAKDLERLVVGALSDRGLLFEGVKAFSGSRRLTLSVLGLPAKQPDVKEEKKGPRVDAPAKAIEGFLRSAGVTLEQCQKQSDAKGEFYVAVIDRKGRATAEVLAEVLPECFAKLPWPKSMKWDGPTRWVRPLHSILCTFDGEVVPFEFAGVTTGNTTRGHRFLSSGEIEARHFEDYEKKLRDAHVILDADERKEIIVHEAKQKAFALGLELIEDQGLLEEVSGLAEWPVVLIGTIEDQFMDVPAEILQTSMRVHQKYFSLRDPKTGKLANRFVVISNMVAEDGGKEIVAGNERVLRARLSDAKFFWDQDRKTPIAEREGKLKDIKFAEGMGTQYMRVARIHAMARRVAEVIGADADCAARAGQLCKNDLVTEVVGEFPELQGLMGAYYAANDGLAPEIVLAIRDHYKPSGLTDAIPETKTGMAVAISDKIDLFTSFFARGKAPTGSSDPFGLRRAIIGVIRIVDQSKIRLPLRPIFDAAWEQVRAQTGELQLERKEFVALALDFVADRLKVSLRDKGASHELIDAVFSLGNEDDLVRLVARVEALQAFLKTDDGANLLGGYKRAANILKIERKKEKDDAAFSDAPDRALFELPEEENLSAALTVAKAEAADALAKEDFAAAMSALAGLRGAVDAFFEKVTVNAPEPHLRANRLKLLAEIVSTAHTVADFSKIEG